jgi:hypothetical protein
MEFCGEIAGALPCRGLLTKIMLNFLLTLSGACCADSSRISALGCLKVRPAALP